MFKHVLSTLFQPSLIAVITDTDLPILSYSSMNIGTNVLIIDLRKNTDLPNNFNNQPKFDLVLICTLSKNISKSINFLNILNPSSLILLDYQDSSNFSSPYIKFYHEWAFERSCKLIRSKSFGLQCPHIGLNLSLYPNVAIPGKVALISESGAIAAAVMDWAEDTKIGFSIIISIDKEGIVDISEIFDYLISDIKTESVVVYIEDINFARKWLSSLKALASIKPVIVLKSGKHENLRNDAVLDAILRRTGVVRINQMVQLFSALKALSNPTRLRGRRLVLLSNDFSLPKLALDALGPGSMIVNSELSQRTKNDIRNILHFCDISLNSVVVLDYLNGCIIEKIIDILVKDENVDGILLLLAPDFKSNMDDIVSKISKLIPQLNKTVVSCFMGDYKMRFFRKILDNFGIITFRTPESASYAFNILSTHYYNQKLLSQIQPSSLISEKSNIEAAQNIIDNVRLNGRVNLYKKEIENLFDIFNINLLYCEQTKWNSFESTPIAIHVWQDRIFGPVIQFGVSGEDLVSYRDSKGIDVPPLNKFLAKSLIDRSGIGRISFIAQMSYVATELLIDILVQISEMISELSDINTIDIDPIYAGSSYIRAPNIRIGLRFHKANSFYKYAHMTIKPYPIQLIDSQKLNNGIICQIRPIRPEDANLLQNFIKNLSEKSRYMRFVSNMKELTSKMLAKYTQIDYHRELALIACLDVVANMSKDSPIIIGFAHYLMNIDGRGAEYALVIADDWQRLGLGKKLMTSLIEAAKSQGLDYINGLVLTNNKPMLSLTKKLNFITKENEFDKDMVQVVLDLNNKLY